jgi:hypothetical protein
MILLSTSWKLKINKMINKNRITWKNYKTLSVLKNQSQMKITQWIIMIKPALQAKKMTKLNQVSAKIVSNLKTYLRMFKLQFVIDKWNKNIRNSIIKWKIWTRKFKCISKYLITEYHSISKPSLKRNKKKKKNNKDKC